MKRPEDEPADRDAAGERPRASRRRPVRRAVTGSLSFLVTFGIVALVLAAWVSLQERPLVAPPWLKARIEARLDQTLDGLSVDFAEVALIVDDGWKPRLRLRDLDIRRLGSDARLTLSDLEGSVAVGPLLEGKLRPDTVYLTGAQMRLERDADGGFDLKLGTGDGAAESATGARKPPQQVSGGDLGALAEEVEAVLDLPDLKGLRRIEATGLTLRYEDARAGRAWTVDGGRAVLERDGDHLQLRGDFALLSGRAWAATLSLSYDSRIGEKAASFAMSFDDLAARDLATQGAALAWLDVLDAPISGALRATVDDEGRLGPLNASLQIGKGALRPADGTPPIPFEMARSYFTFDPVDQALHFDELSVESRYLTARAEGALHLLGTAAGRPTKMVGQLRMTEFTARPGDVMPDPVSFSDVRADLRLELDPFRLTIGQLLLGQGADRVALQGEVRAQDAGWDVTASGSLARISPARLLSLWPQPLAVKTREWMEKFVAAGELRDIQMGLRLRPATARPDLYLGFEFHDAEMTVVKGLPPAREVTGHATLSRNRFVAVAEAGHIVAPQGGRVDLDGTVFVVPDTRIKPAPAEVELRTEGTITATLALLDEEPFRIMQKAGRPVAIADGRLRLDGTIGFPLKKGRTPEDYEVAMEGTISDMRSDVLIPGRQFAARELSLRLVDHRLTIEGIGRVDAVPVGGRYAAVTGREADGTARLEGWIELSERFADAFRVGLPPGSLSGKGRAGMTLELARDKPPRFELTSDLAGVGLSLPALDWSLPRNTEGELRVAGALAKPVRIESIEMDAPGFAAQGRLDLTADGALAAARFDRVQVGGWLDAPVVLTGRGKGRSPSVSVTGGRIDLRRTQLGKGGSGASRGGSDGAPLELSLDRLQVTDTIALTGFRGDFSTTGGISGRFSGSVNGAAAVTGTVVPREGRSAIRITAQNAGAVLAATRLLKQGRGGTMDLTLTPVGRAGNYDGRLDVQGLRIHEAPAMAALLNAISVVGLVEQMASGGIVFSDVEARFRLTPDQLILLRSSAVGASLGLSMDGVYNFDARRMNMQGVISPVYMLNGIGSVFTRKGEGLFGFNYALQGEASRPRVSINPLSLLTPGMFREIFRSPPPRISQAPTQ